MGAATYSPWATSSLWSQMATSLSHCLLGPLVQVNNGHFFHCHERGPEIIPHIISVIKFRRVWQGRKKYNSVSTPSSCELASEPQLIHEYIQFKPGFPYVAQSFPELSNEINVSLTDQRDQRGDVVLTFSNFYYPLYKEMQNKGWYVRSKMYRHQRLNLWLTNTEQY